MTSRDYVTWWNSRPLLVCNLFRKMMNVVFPSVSHSSTEYPSKLELGIFSLHFYELARWIHGPIEMNRYVLFISEFFFPNETTRFQFDYHNHSANYNNDKSQSIVSRFSLTMINQYNLTIVINWPNWNWFDFSLLNPNWISLDFFSKTSYWINTKLSFLLTKVTLD